MPAVLVADVEASGEGGRSVDDDDLAMVAQVDGLKEHAAHREELGHLDPRVVQRAPPAAAQREAPEPVHQQAHVHPALRRRDEALAKPCAGRVVTDQVVLRVHGSVAGGVEQAAPIAS